MRSAIAVACVPVAFALIIFAARTRAVPLTGDEPHYLIIADSVASDLDLDLHNNYLRDFDTHRIFGLTIPHVYNVPRGWMPGHEPGLGILLALPFRIGGIAGARVALCLAAGLLPWSLMRWLRTQMPADTAAWLTLGLTLCFPIVFGAQQIYNDLLGGIVATSLFLQVARWREPRQASWAFFLACGLLPWLHVKFALTALLLACGGVAVSGRRALKVAPLFAVGPVLQMAFNVWASGSPLGFRHANELTHEFGRGAELFLGLHLDQSQGMFAQQPLLLAGVVALPFFFRRRPRLAIAWAAVYGSLILPNALELTRYGGDGPAGRFAWSAAWMWAVPIGIVVGERHARLARWVRRAAIAGWMYQAALAVRWLSTPGLLFPSLDERLALRDSLFPVALRGWLPSFYFWDFSSYWTYAPNVAAFAVVALLLVAGTRTTMRGAVIPADAHRV